MGRNKTISERESPRSETLGDHQPLPDEVVEMLIEATEQGGGLSKDIGDYGWFGGYDDKGERRLSDVEVEQYLNGNLNEFSSLEEIFVEIARQHRSENGFSEEEEFLEAAREAAKKLTGSATKPPQKNQLSEVSLIRIAKAYHTSSFEVDHENKFITDMIYNVLALKSGDGTSKSRDNATAKKKEKFYEQFQRLMFKITTFQTEEQLARRAKIHDIARRISDLKMTDKLPKIERSPDDT